MLSVWFVLFVLFLPGMVEGQTRSSLESRRKKLQRDIEYTNRLLRENKKKQEASVGQIQKIELNIQTRTRLIGTLQQELIWLEQQIDSNLVEIRSLEAGLESLKSDYARMVRQAYLQRKKHNRWISILSARGMGEALRRSAYYSRIEALRRGKAIHIRSTRDTLTVRVAQLEMDRQRKAGALAEVNSQAASLASEKAEKERQMALLRGKEAELMVAIRKKQAESEQLSKKINEIIQRELAEARRKAEAEAKRKAEEEAKRRAESGSSGGSSGSAKPPTPASIRETPESAALSRDFSGNKGKLPWPVERGVVIGKFGRHPHPVFNHVEIQRDGIDIGTDKNSGVRAVFRGEVTTVIRMPGYEHVVIIRHGSYLTVYGNLASVQVKKGDAIQTRQRLGIAYHDEESGRTLVHFRVMAGEAAENPEIWLAK